MFRSRQFLVFFALIAILFLLFIRLFCLQVINYEKFSRIASGQHNKVMIIEPRRGTIFDRNMEPLAINLDVPSIFCNPREIRDKNKTASQLAAIFNINSDELLKKLKSNKGFIWVKRKIDAPAAEKIKKLSLAGVYFMDESKRYYPSDNMASHVIGFANIDNNGLEGIELAYDRKLKGKPGLRRLMRDARRRTILFDEKESVPQQDGHSLILTVDSVIQCIVEEELAAMIKRFNASAGSIIVMEAATGRILALANYPSYDLNKAGNTAESIRKDDAISSVYEPGSVFKIVLASAALSEKTVTLNDTYYCENGEYKVCGRTLHDVHPYGKLAFREIMAKSSNIGVVKVAMKLGADKLYKYIKSFGFGEKTGIDLPGEVSGINRPPRVWSKSDITTIPIGQGIAVTPLQLVTAINVIANGGYLVKPYVVEKIMTWEGGVYKEFKPVTKRKVLEKATCDLMRTVLHAVVTEGTGQFAKSSLYELCGKTGTAQMVKPDRGYYDNKYHSTFVGFAPFEKPVLSIVVTAKEAHPYHFGGTVAGPAFKNVAERTLQYLGYPTKVVKKSK